MSTALKLIRALYFILWIACAVAYPQPSPRRAVDPAAATLGRGFVSSRVSVNGTSLHYVRGGRGPAVILLHGFPQDWYEFRRVMPRLAENFTVVAVDLRGVGGSAPTPGGYDEATMAEDIYQLAQRLKLGRVYVAGHDIGGMVAYAFARLHPEAARGVMVLDVPLPGVEPWEEVKADPRLWHFGFHQVPGLAEKVLTGRQAVYFREGFFDRLASNTKVFTDEDVRHFANSYAAPGQLRAGMEFYRAFPAAEKFNDSQRGALEVPIVLAGGDRAVGQLAPRMAEGLRRRGCANVTAEIIKDSGHYVADEQPAAVAELIERYARL